MGLEKLAEEIADGVAIWGYEEKGAPGGAGCDADPARVCADRAVAKGDRSEAAGVPAQRMASGPVLIGTWADAAWAIRFYRRHGFEVVGAEEKDRLLKKKYWKIPERQVETSVVLADATWRSAGGA